MSATVIPLPRSRALLRKLRRQLEAQRRDDPRAEPPEAAVRLRERTGCSWQEALDELDRE